MCHWLAGSPRRTLHCSCDPARPCPGHEAAPGLQELVVGRLIHRCRLTHTVHVLDNEADSLLQPLFEKVLASCCC